MKAKLILASLAILLLSTGAHAKNFPIPDPLRGGCKVDADCVKVDTNCANCCEFDAVLKEAQAGYITARTYSCGVQTEECKCTDSGDHLKPVCVEHRCVLTSISRE